MLKYFNFIICIDTNNVIEDLRLTLKMRNIFFLDIQECDIENNCLNGATCVDGIGSYTCDCATGYTGLNCETGLYIVFNYIYIYSTI